MKVPVLKIGFDEFGTIIIGDRNKPDTIFTLYRFPRRYPPNAMVNTQVIAVEHVRQSSLMLFIECLNFLRAQRSAYPGGWPGCGPSKLLGYREPPDRSFGSGSPEIRFDISP